jgi:hypothetical protein
MDRLEGMLGNLVTIQIPGPLDNYDWDAAVREKAELLGVPAKLVRSEDDVKKLRDARAKAMKEAQAAQAKQIEKQQLMDAATKGNNGKQ